MASFSCSSISNTWRESRKLHRSPVSIMAWFQSAIAAASPLVKYSTTVCLSVKVLLTLVRSWTNLVTLASAVKNISFVALTCEKCFSEITSVFLSFNSDLQSDFSCL
ncbi:unnamed protein product [Sphagnum jensenii]|uniref:Uncharacterized protein n=1 Tax=Sphagnum jensenii TaxID=128206 RepID=A0ABP0VPZ2_9BRYO